MKFALATAAASLMATTAFAGGYVAPIVETPVIVAPMIQTQSNDWTGFYAGLQLGMGTAKLSYPTSTPPDLEGDFKAYGLHAGYNHDFGQFVLGGELDYNKLDIDDLDEKADLTRLRMRAGYDMGQFMPYVTLGAARVSYDGSSETGMTYGIGADYMLSQKFVLGAEYTHQKWDDVSDTDDLDLKAGMFQVRASYKF